MINRAGNDSGSFGASARHIGSRGSLSSLRDAGPEDFSEGIGDEDLAWEQAVRAAMLTRQASFSQRWHEGDWESWDEPMDEGEMACLWGPFYRRPENEPPFGRR